MTYLEIYKAIAILHKINDELCIDADIDSFVRYYLNFPNFSDESPHLTASIITVENYEIIKKLNGPYGKAYAASLLIRYCT